MVYFALIKRKGSKSFIGAIPFKKGTSKKAAMVFARKNINPKLSYRIVTEQELNKFANKAAIIIKKKKKRKTIKKKKPIKRRFRKKKYQN